MTKSTMSSGDENGGGVKDVAKACNKFNIDFLKALKEKFSKNLVYSPFSLSAVMAMIQVGAKGNTLAEIKKVFYFPENDKLSNGYQSVLKSLKVASKGYTISTENKIYFKKGFEVLTQYENELKDNFHAETQELDFEKSEKAAKTINQWVEKSTHKRIKNIISSDSLDKDTSLVLVNAIYFKGVWEHPFDRKNTEKGDFFLNMNDKIKVDFMRGCYAFPYAVFHNIDAHAVALPYKGDRLCMVVIAPKVKNRLEVVEKGLKKYALRDIFGKLFEGTNKNLIAVKLPRFKIESTMELVEILKGMGLTKVFDQKDADLSGIAAPTFEDGNLFITDVIQKAFVEVNEQGTEAAAATGVGIVAGGTCRKETPIITPFHADRPFVFQIIDVQTRCVLFAGRCTNPTK